MLDLGLVLDPGSWESWDAPPAHEGAHVGEPTQVAQVAPVAAAQGAPAWE